MKPSKTNYEYIILASHSSLLKGTLTDQEQILFQMQENPHTPICKMHNTGNYQLGSMNYSNCSFKLFGQKKSVAMKMPH